MIVSNPNGGERNRRLERAHAEVPKLESLAARGVAAVIKPVAFEKMAATRARLAVSG